MVASEGGGGVVADDGYGVAERACVCVGCVYKEVFLPRGSACINCRTARVG